MDEPGARLDALANTVIGAAIEVHRQLGPGYLESVYEEAMAVELSLRGIPYVRQPGFKVNYKGQPVGHSRLDFLISNELVVELKSVDQLGPVHTAQAISYLKATGHRLALLINFNVRILSQGGIKRVVRSQ